MPTVNTTAVDDTTTLIEQIKTLAVVRERVTLSSGRTADYYVDMRRVSLDGYAAPIIGRVMRDLVADWDFDAVGGLTLGADPVATAMLHAAAAAGERLDAFVVRKAGEGARPAAADRGQPGRGPSGAGGGGHQHHRRLGADRGPGAARGRARRWSAWR